MAKRPESAALYHESGLGWSASSLRGSGRSTNSDAVATSADGACRSFVVADGVGALEASPRASAAAARSAAAWASRHEAVDEGDVSELLGVVDKAVKDAIRGDRGATTLAFASVNNTTGVIFTVGDSEVLAVAEHGPARRLNPLDHVPAQPNMLLAWIDGTIELEPHVINLDALPFRLVLATDGVTGTLDRDVIAEIVRSAPIEVASMNLVEAARDAGAVDDASAIVVAQPRTDVPA